MPRSRVGPCTASQGARTGPSDSNLKMTPGLNTPNLVTAQIGAPAKSVLQPEPDQLIVEDLN